MIALSRTHAQTLTLPLHTCVERRLYTSSSFPLFNRPMREGTKPHPIRFTMYILMEGLKMLRKVAAKIGAATACDTCVPC